MANKMSLLNGSKKKLYLGGAVIAVILILLYFGYETAVVYDVETHLVERGEFVIDVVVPGELKAHQSKLISVPMEVRSDLQIVSMVPEGEEVEAGDWLVRFDIASLEDRLISEQEDLFTKLQELEELLEKQKVDSVSRAASLEIQQLSFQQKEIQFEMAKFEAENSKRRMEIDMEKSKLQLQEQITSIKRQEQNAQKTLQRKYDDIERQKEDIAEIENQIQESTIYAPIPGLVVYKKTWSGGEEVKIKVGDTVRRRQELMELPDLSEMRIDATVNEVDVSKIKRRQEVIIRLDVNQEIIYYGTVSDIGYLPQRSARGAGNNIKVYDLEVAVENADQDESLKPGMSATCQIITDRIQDVVFVPIQSVFQTDEEPFVYVKDGSSYEKTVVVTGAKNNNYIVIEEGLEEGQEVTLRDPYSALEQLGTEESDVPKPAGGVAPQTEIDPMQLMREMGRRGGGRGGMDVRH
ncbi:efflux RND transporter periplasmic adaptor subunit [candidate division KSB1 bacterium]